MPIQYTSVIRIWLLTFTKNSDIVHMYLSNKIGSSSRKVPKCKIQKRLSGLYFICADNGAPHQQKHKLQQPRLPCPGNPQTQRRQFLKVEWHIRHSTIAQRVRENYQHNKLTLQIQVMGLLAHSFFCGLYAHTAYKLSLVGSTTTRLAVGLIWIVPPLATSFKKLNKPWLLSFLLWYAGESALLVFHSFLLHSLQNRASLAIATTSTVVQTAMAGLVFLRRS